MRLFLYGTLLAPDRLRRLGGDPARLCPAMLPGSRRATLRRTPYPTLVRARGATTPGAVLDVPARGLARMAAYEGPRYRLVRVVVRAGCRAVPAHAWIAPGATRRDWPPKRLP